MNTLHKGYIGTNLVGIADAIRVDYFSLFYWTSNSYTEHGRSHITQELNILCYAIAMLF